MLLPGRHFKYDGKPEEQALALARVFGFCYCWALAGNLTSAAKDDFDEWVREHLAPLVAFPGGGCVFDYQLNTKARGAACFCGRESGRAGR